MKGLVMQKYINSLFIIIFVLLLFFSCEKKQPTNINPVNNIPDTTSHEFEWQFDYFGDGSSSGLRDVCIIDENDIWAVGAIYLRSTSGNNQDTYNSIHWDGKKWNLIQIQFPISGSKNTIPFPAKSVFSSETNQVTFTSAGTLVIKNGDLFFKFCIPSEILIGSINKIWGSLENDLYIVGNLGTLVHYNGTIWQKLDSGTNLDLMDIWGAKDPVSGKYAILAVAGNMNSVTEREILKINGTDVEKISTEGIEWPVYSIWFDPGRVYYTVGAGIYSKETLNDTVKWGGPGLSVTKYTSSAIRGNHANDVFVVGAYGDVLHYNGKSWRSYRDETGLAAGAYTEVAVKGDLVIAVGYEGRRAVVLRGKRRK